MDATWKRFFDDGDEAITFDCKESKPRIRTADIAR
jgi:hypothetical protein